MYLSSGWGEHFCWLLSLLLRPKAWLSPGKEGRILLVHPADVSGHVLEDLTANWAFCKAFLSTVGLSFRHLLLTVHLVRRELEEPVTALTLVTTANMSCVLMRDLQGAGRALVVQAIGSPRRSGDGLTFIVGRLFILVVLLWMVFFLVVLLWRVFILIVLLWRVFILIVLFWRLFILAVFVSVFVRVIIVFLFLFLFGRLFAFGFVFPSSLFIIFTLLFWSLLILLSLLFFLRFVRLSRPCKEMR